MHGVGSNEDDLFRFTNSLPENLIIVSARAPYTLGPNRYVWYEVDFSTGKPIFNAEQAEKSLLVIKLFINQLIERYSVDQSKIYLSGFSQGAIMSYSAGLTFPEKLAGIAALSGRILEEIRPLIKTSPALHHLKVLIAHGTADNVLPVHYAREAKTLIDQYGPRLTYHEYTIGHSIDQFVLTDLNQWLRQE